MKNKKEKPAPKESPMKIRRQFPGMPEDNPRPPAELPPDSLVAAIRSGKVKGRR